MAEFPKKFIFQCLLLAEIAIVSTYGGTSECLPGKHRPQYHFSQKANWMNDPNGMFYLDGEYHLCFQYNPYDTVWGPMHWGHAFSNDLVHWEELETALHPDSLGTIFSGGAVIDWENSTGLRTGKNEVVIATFTHDGDTQQQSIAYSNDKGRHFFKFVGNPVVENPGIKDFRDPKVILHDGKWIMSLAQGDRIVFYGSVDLIDWTYLSEFGANEGAHGGVWECPDLIPFQVDGETVWALIVSLNPGGPNEGCATQYFIGDFDGTTFTSRGWNEKQWLDWGPDDYAGVTFSDEPQNRPVFIGYMSNWVYANEVPTSPWRGQMTIPRILSLKSVEGQIWMASEPVPELNQLYNPNQRIEKIEEVVRPGTIFFLHQGISFQNPLVEVDLNMTIEGSPRFGVCFGNYENEEVCVVYDHLEKTVLVDRSKSGETSFHPEFNLVSEGKRIMTQETIDMKIFMDVSSIEVFVDEGLTSLTSLFFPSHPLDVLIYMYNIEDRAGNVIVHSAVVQGLNSIYDCP